MMLSEMTFAERNRENKYMNHLSGSLYEEIVRDMQEGVMVVSMGGRIVMLNPAAERILGIAPEDIGKTYTELFLIDEKNDAFNETILNTIYEKAKAQKVPVDFAKDGRTINLLLTTSYIYNSGEKSVVVVIDDVTKLNELRMEQVAREAAEKANEAKSHFLANMSHEIRTPINAVLGMNEMILRESKEQQILEYAANIKSSGKTLLFLINDILDLSKIESGKMDIVQVNYEVSALIIDLWNIIYLRAKEKNLAFDVKLDETLPGVLYGDDVRIKQIVINLLTNAVKYTQEGRVELGIAYEQKSDEELLLKISVKDTGMGIRREEMGKLFESFKRIDEEKNRNIEGTGLGMSITMSLLKMMGGEMNVESEYQKGSIFTVSIPQKIVDTMPVGSFNALREKGIRQINDRKVSFTAPEGRVLVVDDNAMNRTVFKALLKRTKLQIVAADSGKQCLEYVQQQMFHIIFMDHMMPEMDGIETLHRIRKLSDFPNRDTPVIALTANATAGAREMYFKEGFTDFVTKPIDGDVLESVILKYIPKELVHADKDDDSDQPKSGADEYEVYLKKGVSIKNGLNHLQGDMDTYMELVHLFIKDKSKTLQLREYLSEHNTKDYAIQAHALKGNARTLGADKLADAAYEHEMWGKAGKEDELNAHWEHLEQEWNSTLEVFEEVYAKYILAQEQTDTEKSSQILELTQEDLQKAAALIDDFETKEAVKLIRKWLESPLKADIQRRLDDALWAIENEFDEDKAIALLTKQEERKV